jgi:hypothetical protein
MPNPRLAAVGGNHDQWRGRGYMHSVGYAPSLRDTHFRGTPWKRLWRSEELVLELYGLDSNAGLSQTSASWSQKGAFDLSSGGEVDRLVADLQQNWPSKPNLSDGVRYRARALVFHHSLSELDQASVTKVLELAETYAIAAVLTGHIHEFYSHENATMPNGMGKLWELRCASTLQAPESRQKPAPGLLAHKIFVENCRVRWQVWRYEWNHLSQGFSVLSKDLTKSFADFWLP